MSNSFQNKSVFLTGASSGIGAALARELYRRGASLTLCARRIERLSSFVAAVAVRCDVRQKEDLDRAVEQARKRFGKIDVVIANAGFGVAGKLEELSTADYRFQFETNVFGVLETIYATLDDLKKSKGTLVILGSIAGFVALPGMSPYSMSKFAVRALAEAITHELEPHGISVVLISPGFVESEIRKVDNEGIYQAQAQDPIPEWVQMNTDVAANHILRAVERRRPHQIITQHGKFVVFFVRHFPWLFHKLVRWKKMRGRREPIVEL